MDIYFRPTAAARRTLPSDIALGWWNDGIAIPRNRQNQRINVAGQTYQVRELNEYHEEYIRNVFREGPIWEVDGDPHPDWSTPYRRDIE